MKDDDKISTVHFLPMVSKMWGIYDSHGVGGVIVKILGMRILTTIASDVVDSKINYIIEDGGEILVDKESNIIFTGSWDECQCKIMKNKKK